jgi:hypothetical protein
MILENSNIDKVFRERLKDVEIIPPPDIWEDIRDNIQTGRKKIPVIYYAVAAASLALFLLAGTTALLFRSKPDKKELAENIGLSQEKQKSEKKIDLVATSQETLPAIPDLPAEEHQPDAKPVPDNTVMGVESAKSEGIQTEAISIKALNLTEYNKELDFSQGSNRNEVIGTESVEGIKSTDNLERLTRINWFSFSELSKPEILLGHSQTKEEKSFSGYYSETEDASLIRNISHWSVGGQFSPVYTFREITHSRSEEYKESYDDLEDALLAFSGGVNVEFKTRNRFTIHSGIYYSRMGQRINEILFYPDGSVGYQEGGYLIRNSTGEIKSTIPGVTFADKKGNRVTPYINPMQRPNLNPVNADIVQKFEYLEIPLIFKYKLIDKKMDFNILGGFNTNFLMGNKAYIWYNDEKIPVGRTTDIYSFNFSSTIGVGFQFELSNKLTLNLEPTFKYYINSVNKRSLLQTHPYSIGIFSGLSYNF